MASDNIPAESNKNARLNHLLDLTAQIVSSHVSATSIPSDQVPDLITSVFSSLSALALSEDKGNASRVVTIANGERPKPAVPVSQSVGRDHLICLEDGRKVKLLHRYLRTRYRMTPSEYRIRWGLDPNYPMVAPAYSESRRAHAIQVGFRSKVEVPALPPKASGRKKAAPAEPAPAPAQQKPRRKLGIVTP